MIMEILISFPSSTITCLLSIIIPFVRSTHFNKLQLFSKKLMLFEITYTPFVMIITTI